MAPRGRKKKAGLMREDAARDAMRSYGFNERVIKESIKELLEGYGEDHWFMVEEDRYEGLLNICLEKQGQEEEMAEEQQEEEETTNVPSFVLQEQEQEQEQPVEDRRDHVGSNSTSLVGCGTETGTQACQNDADSSQAPLFADEASGDYAYQSVGGASNSRCGWISSEEEMDPEEDGAGDGGSDGIGDGDRDGDGDDDGGGDDNGDNDDDDDDDDEMIQLTPEPLCEELEELLREVRGQKKRKRATRWDN